MGMGMDMIGWYVGDGNGDGGDGEGDGKCAICTEVQRRLVVEK